MTSETIYEAPPAQTDALDPSQPNAVPAEALETPQGVQLLTRLQVPLPERLARKVRRIPMTVHLRGQIKPSYLGSASESMFLRIEAAAPGGHREIYGPEGWFISRAPAKSPGRKKSDRKEGDVIELNDRSPLEGMTEALQASAFKWNHYANHWEMRVTKKFPEQFAAWLQSLPPHWERHFDKLLGSLAGDPVQASVKLDCQEAGIDWFDVHVHVDIGQTDLTPAEIQLLLKARGQHVRLGDKGWRRLDFDISEEDDRGLARLGLSPHDFSDEPQRLHAFQLADDAANGLLPEEQMERIRARAGALKARVTPAVPETVRANLRPYQVEGFHFLSYLSTNSFGGVLADDMGLGKTLQTLSWLAWLRREPDAARKPTLVVCPKSVMDTWRGEAERFLPHLRVHLWTATASLPAAQILTQSDLLVVNYAQLRVLEEELTRADWLAVILDEGQYIKNPNSLTARAACRLRADHRLVLSGTPIENRLLDLWSLMQFAMPGVLGNRAQFARRYDPKKDPLARHRLASRVRPFLLRRTKRQVAGELPDRVEEDIYCELEHEQKMLYDAEFKHARRMLLDIKTSRDLDQNRFHFLTSLLRLRQICCHPSLVSDKFKKAKSAKVLALLDLLEPVMEEGNKVLVFSQFVSMLKILQEEVKKRKWKQFYLAGETENRGDLVRAFQNCPDGALFLISLKAGGFGLNLTSASYVALFDPWWNPAVENQAIDRTHRIGQTRNVMAYRFLIKNSIEEKIRLLQKQKSALANDVLGEERFAQSLTLDDLHYLFADNPEPAA